MTRRQGILILPDMVRVLTRVLLGLLAFVVIGVVAGIVYWKMDEWNFSRRAPLAANLPPNFEEASSVFRTRIIERFPVGSNAGQLVRVLSDQGFRQNTGYLVYFEYGVTFGRSGERSNTLTLTRLNFPCRLVWNVVSTAEEFPASVAE